MAVTAIRMGLSRTTWFSPFKLLYGREKLVPDEISTWSQYRGGLQLGGGKHIEQFVETHNQAMSNDRNYYEKMKLAFDKKKVGKRLVTNFILGDHVWMDI